MPLNFQKISFNSQYIAKKTSLNQKYKKFPAHQTVRVLIHLSHLPFCYDAWYSNEFYADYHEIVRLISYQLFCPLALIQSTVDGVLVNAPKL